MIEFTKQDTLHFMIIILCLFFVISIFYFYAGVVSPVTSQISVLIGENARLQKVIELRTDLLSDIEEQKIRLNLQK